MFLSKPSANTGLARHSAITNGSFPSACKDFAQHLGLVGVLCHAIHFSLQLLGSDWPMPVSLAALVSRAGSLRLSFPSAPETSPNQAMVSDHDALLARSDDASKRPQWLADKLHVQKTTESSGKILRTPPDERKPSSVALNTEQAAPAQKKNCSRSAQI